MTMTFTEGTMYAALLLPSFAFFLSVSARPAAAVARLACLGLGCVASAVFAVRLSGLLSGSPGCCPARGCSAAGTFLADTRPRSTWGCSPCPCC